MYRDYRDAFEPSTGLPLSLHQPAGELDCGAWAKIAVGHRFCGLLGRANHACEICFGLQKRLEEEADREPKTLKCFAGVCETAVPVRVGAKLVAFLQTGGILLEAPSQHRLSKITGEFLRLGTRIDLKQVEDAYFALRVLKPQQYEAMVKLLSIFATDLGECGNLMVLQRGGAQQPAVAHARRIIDAGFREELSLGEVARQVNVSPGYLSELFKNGTGLNFVEYVAGLRVGKAKSLLQTSTMSISEVAFAVGFQSLSQFNRTFLHFGSVPPRAYRASLPESQYAHPENMRSLSAEVRRL